MFFLSQNLVDTASTIVDPKYKNHWRRVESLTGGTSEDLIHAFDGYISTLIESQEDTYTNPFEIVTENLGKCTVFHRVAVPNWTQNMNIFVMKIVTFIKDIVSLQYFLIVTSSCNTSL